MLINQPSDISVLCGFVGLFLGIILLIVAGKTVYELILNFIKDRKNEAN